MGNDPVNNIDPSGGVIESGLFAGATELGRSIAMTLGGAIMGQAIHALTGGGVNFNGALIGAAAGFGASLVASFNWSYLFNGSSTLNFFVTGTEEYMSSTGKLDAQRLDLLWAKTKAIFSFGKLRIIRAKDMEDAAQQIKATLEEKGKTLGSIIVNSHAHAEVSKDDESGRDYDPLTSTLAIGNGDNPANRLDPGSDIENNVFLKTLSPYVTSATKFFAGNCWGGAPGGNLEILKRMSQVGNWKNATFYGEASETISGSLLLKNTYSARGHIDVGFYERGGVYNFNGPGTGGRKHPNVTFNPYKEKSNMGVFQAVRNGQVFNPGTVYFNRGASIFPTR